MLVVILPPWPQNKNPWFNFRISDHKLQCHQWRQSCYHANLCALERWQGNWGANCISVKGFTKDSKFYICTSQGAGLKFCICLKSGQHRYEAEPTTFLEINPTSTDHVYVRDPNMVTAVWLRHGTKKTHDSWCVIILTKFLPLAAPEIVIITTSSADCDEDFVK